MQKIVLLLIFIPIFLITALNFHEGNQEVNLHEANRFTCTACHATIIDGIIIGGKGYIKNNLSVELTIPNKYDAESVVFNSDNIKEDKTSIYEYVSEFEEANRYLIADLYNDKEGKKENTIKLQYQITEEDILAGFIEIQGVLSNLDGTEASDYAFSKKISIDIEESKTTEPALLYPYLAQNFIQIDNLEWGENIAIFNMLGQQIFLQQNVAESERIDVSNFQNGNYFVLVNQKESLKFIVSK